MASKSRRFKWASWSRLCYLRRHEHDASRIEEVSLILLPPPLFPAFCPSHAAPDRVRDFTAFRHIVHRLEPHCNISTNDDDDDARYLLRRGAHDIPFIAAAISRGGVAARSSQQARKARRSSCDSAMILASHISMGLQNEATLRFHLLVSYRFR